MNTIEHLKSFKREAVDARDQPAEFPWIATDLGRDLEEQALEERRKLGKGPAWFEERRKYRTLKDVIFDAAKSEMFYTVAATNHQGQPRTGVLNLCTLQHLELRYIQSEIAQVIGKWNRDEFWGDDGSSLNDSDRALKNPNGPPPMRGLLRDYCNAVRDLDFMKECALHGYEEDPFLLKTSRELDRRILETAWLGGDNFAPAQDAQNPQLRTHGRHKANRMAHAREQSIRLLFAIAGGLLLLVPTLIMANVPGKVASLVTTCVSMLIFVVLIAFLTKLSPNEVLATTAAYAAVLVVFVGTSLRP